MIWVTLKDGTELQYNTATHARRVRGFYELGTDLPISNNMVVAIAIDSVFRLEFEKPCKIIKLRRENGP